MSIIQFYDNKILFVDNKIAFGSDCCCFQECDRCIDSIAPQSMRITLAGIAAGSDSDYCDEGECASLNGEYIIPWTYYRPCMWAMNLTDGVCDEFFTLHLRMYPTNTNFIDVTLYWERASDSKEWHWSVAHSGEGTVDCLNLDVTLPYTSSSSDIVCDFNNSTARVETI